MSAGLQLSKTGETLRRKGKGPYLRENRGWQPARRIGLYQYKFI